MAVAARLDVLRVLDGLDCDRGVEGSAAGGRYLACGRRGALVAEGKARPPMVVAVGSVDCG